MPKSSERSGQRQQQQERGFEQPGHQGVPQQDQQDGASESQTQQPRPTWGEQTPDMDQQRAVGGGGTSSDSDGQQQFSGGDAPDSRGQQSSRPTRGGAPPRKKDGDPSSGAGNRKRG